MLLPVVGFCNSGKASLITFVLFVYSTVLYYSHFSKCEH